MTHGLFERARRVWDLPSNPVVDVVRKPERYSNDLDFYSAEEVMQLVGAAASEQDAAICPLSRAPPGRPAWRESCRSC